MKASELIGKKAIRTGPTCYGDYSYTTDPLIDKVTDYVLVKYPEDSFHARLLGNDTPHILDRRWNDDNWTDYEEDELMSIEAPNPTEDINPVKN